MAEVPWAASLSTAFGRQTVGTDLKGFTPIRERL